MTHNSQKIDIDLPIVVIIRRWPDGYIEWASQFKDRLVEVIRNSKNDIEVNLIGHGKGQMHITTFPSPYQYMTIGDNVVHVLLIGEEDLNKTKNMWSGSE